MSNIISFPSRQLQGAPPQVLAQAAGDVPDAAESLLVAQLDVVRHAIVVLELMIKRLPPTRDRDLVAELVGSMRQGLELGMASHQRPRHATSSDRQ